MSQRRQKMHETRPQTACTKVGWTLGHVVFAICRLTDCEHREIDMGWVHPWVWLDWVGLGRSMGRVGLCPSMDRVGLGLVGSYQRGRVGLDLVCLDPSIGWVGLGPSTGWVGSNVFWQCRGSGWVQWHCDGLGQATGWDADYLHVVAFCTKNIRLIKQNSTRPTKLKIFHLLLVVIRIQKSSKVCNSSRPEIIKNCISRIVPHLTRVNSLGCQVDGLSGSVCWYDGLGSVCKLVGRVGLVKKVAHLWDTLITSLHTSTGTGT